MVQIGGQKSTAVIVIQNQLRGESCSKKLRIQAGFVSRLYNSVEQSGLSSETRTPPATQH